MNLKKYLVLLLPLCLLLCINAQATAEEKEQTEEILISSFGTEECVEQLSELGVTIPRELRGINIQKVVAAFESDPELQLVVNYTVANDFFKDVRHAINRYHGWSDKKYDTTPLRYTLQYSTLYSWNPSTMPYYNCVTLMLLAEVQHVILEISRDSITTTWQIFQALQMWLKMTLKDSLVINALRNKRLGHPRHQGGQM